MTNMNIKSNSVGNHKPRNFIAGMTLIEVIIYSVLLSMLMAGFIQYAITIHLENINLSNDIENAYK